MTALVWLFFALACFFSGYISYRVTRWNQRRKFNNTLKYINKMHGANYRIDSHKYMYVK